ncbi:succinyl-CoA synthetase subunit beta [Marinobacter sp. F4216]|uniref:succinyl-CoA synthetase subunit beta n=1 Tax=Marinobacter sp. F4216 TaxID=2874281 RepID=UPI001CBF9C14|nr:succinyl-CoA synthetase subunit beta [Marinobacter sp. F4216]
MEAVSSPNRPGWLGPRSLAFLVVLIVTPLLFFGGPDWFNGPFGSAVWNLGHIGFFGLVTLAAHPWRRLSGWQLWILPTVVVLLIGGAIEVIQSDMGREASWHDMLRNLIGVWFVLAWHPLLDENRSASPTTPPALIIASTLLLLFELGTTAAVGVQQFKVAHQLPLLYDFRHDDPTPYWYGELTPSQEHASPHGQSLRLDFDTKLYSGGSLSNLPSDWRDYEQLSMTLFNPNAHPLQMTLRINDWTHSLGNNAHSDRYNIRLTLQPGSQTFTIELDDIEKAPRTRRMEMDNISQFKVFVSRLPEPATIYIQDLRLE